MNEFEAAFFYGDYSEMIKKFKLDEVKDFWYNSSNENIFEGVDNAQEPSVDRC
jgi:ferritin